MTSNNKDVRDLVCSLVGKLFATQAVKLHHKPIANTFFWVCDKACVANDSGVARILVRGRP